MDLVYKNFAHGWIIVMEKGAESDPSTRLKTLTKSSLDTYSYFLWVFSFCMFYV